MLHYERLRGKQAWRSFPISYALLQTDLANSDRAIQIAFFILAIISKVRPNMAGRSYQTSLPSFPSQFLTRFVQIIHSAQPNLKFPLRPYGSSTISICLLVSLLMPARKPFNTNIMKRHVRTGDFLKIQQTSTCKKPAVLLTSPTFFHGLFPPVRFPADFGLVLIGIGIWNSAPPFFQWLLPLVRISADSGFELIGIRIWKISLCADIVHESPETQL